MNLKQLLPNQTVGTLLDICRKYELKNYARLNKDGIINLILQNIKNPQVTEKIKSLIKNNETTALILNLVLSNEGEISYSVLREEMLTERASSTFRRNYKNLIEDFILFEDNSSEDDKVYLPSEYDKYALEVIDILVDGFEPEESEEEDDEDNEGTSSIIYIDQLLYLRRYTTIESLRSLLEKLGLPYSGNKSELVHRLLYESDEPVLTIIYALFSKNELKDICREFELPVYGNKEALITRILSKFSLKNGSPIENIKKEQDGLLKYMKHEVKPTPISMASATAPKHIISQRNSKETLTINSLKGELGDILEKIPLNPAKFKKNPQETLENVISTVLNFSIEEKNKFNGVEVESSKNPSHPSMMVEFDEQRIGLYIKYCNNKKDAKTVKVKSFDYRHEFGDNIIFYVYDPKENITLIDLERLKKDIRIVYKNNREFI